MVIGRWRWRILKDEPEGRIEDLSGAEKDSALGPRFSHHRRQQPFPQHHEVIGFGLSKHQPHALIWLTIDDACLRLKKLGLGEKFYRQGRSYRIRAFYIHITTI